MSLQTDSTLCLKENFSLEVKLIIINFQQLSV
jgi:hypothetical protein